MPSPTDNDPLRTADHDPSGAAPGRDVTADFAPISPPIHEATATHQPGESMRPNGGEPPAGPEAVSVPGYAIDRALGHGGMGVVYEARHLALKRTVALK